MLYYESLDSVEIENAWLTIGSFDGVHLGHQEILGRVVEGARQEKSPAVAITFFPHPAVVLGKRQQAWYLNTPQERAELIGGYGADVVVMHPFTKEVAQQTADEFMQRLVRHLGLRRLIVGPDFALGRGREGNVQRLTELGKVYGYTLEVMPTVKNGDVVISSSLIRNKLNDGEVDQAARYLGRPYRISGEVVRGDARGKALGIPTANLAVWAERTIPKAGVYVCRASISGRSFVAVTNIGVRPTFEQAPVSPRVEAHLLDFDGDIYGTELKLDFLNRLRDEQRFPNVQALVEQIHADIAQARQLYQP